MKKLFAIGEALIDMIPSENCEPIKNVTSFFPKVGGAPANVCGAFSKLGGKSEMLTQLGNDPFGDKIIDEFEKYNIGHKYVFRTDKANTSLAFVALGENGSREFSFYRKPGADMLFSPDKIKDEWFNDGWALHFCSVSLGNFPMKDSHRKAISKALSKNMLVSFDPNLRFPLWNDKLELKKAVIEFMPFAHILKFSDEEIQFITGKKSINDAKDLLFCGNTEIVILTKGAEGAQAYTKTTSVHTDPIKVNAVDTTGAGDAFIGSFLYKLYERGITPQNISSLTPNSLKEILDYSNKYSAESVTKNGALSSYPSKITE